MRFEAGQKYQVTGPVLPRARVVMAAGVGWMCVFGWVVGLDSQVLPVERQATQAAETWVPPHTPDGQPDIQGMWLSQGIGTGRPGPPRTFEEIANTTGGGPWSRAYNREVFFERRPPTSLPGGVVDPPDGQVPLHPWAKARMEEVDRLRDDPPRDRLLDVVDPATLCRPGVPFPMNNATNYNGLQFLQFPGYVLMIAEFNHLYRFIPLDGRPHVGPNIRLRMGDSRGHWEGKTLVVDVTNFEDGGWFDRRGTFHSEAMHLVERFTIVNSDTIAYTATIDDPKVFTRPWTMAGSFHRADAGYELFEYACHEGNQKSLENMVAR